MYQPLNNLAEYRLLFGLFVNTMGMLNVTINDCLTYLHYIGTQGDHISNKEEYKKIVLLYSKLEELLQKDKDAEAAKGNIR